MIKRPLRRVVVEGAAKINVGLRVGDRREDGYHDVEGLIQTISLTDRLEIVTVDEGPIATVRAAGHPELETDDNLIVKAATVLADRIGSAARPLRVLLHKSIPIAAGLGGGSADAAALLIAANALWGAGLPARELVRVAATVGSDVAPILVGGLVHVSGRGERVRSVGAFTAGFVVLGVSSRGIAAADAYAEFDREGEHARSLVLQHNDLEAAALRIDPGLGERLEAMRAAAGLAFVSGSGPTVVGVVARQEEADEVSERVSGVFDAVLVARPSSWGVQLHLGS